MNERIRELCRRASVELDGAKLHELTRQISEPMHDEDAKKNGKGTLPPTLKSELTN